MAQPNYRTEDGVVHSVIMPDSFEGESEEFDISSCGEWLVLKPDQAEELQLGGHELAVEATKDQVTCLMCISAITERPQ